MDKRSFTHIHPFSEPSGPLRRPAKFAGYRLPSPRKPSNNLFEPFRALGNLETTCLGFSEPSERLRLSAKFAGYSENGVSVPDAPLPRQESCPSGTQQTGQASLTPSEPLDGDPSNRGASQKDQSSAARIVVLGAGESGVGAAVLAGAKGYDVFVSDSGTIAEKYKAMLLDRGILFEEGHHTEAQILNADEIVKSPGIPDTAPIVRAAIERGIPILSEIELAGRYTDARMVCITGSNGKTTTTSLTYHILREAGMDVGLAGNIGRSLALQVAEDPHACYVIELSSFQLDNMYRFKADIAVLMNITPDHLNRYGGEMQRYVDAKLRILQNQTRADAFIYWADDPILRREVAKHQPQATCYPFSDADRPELKGRLTADGQICIETPRGTLRIPRTALALRGTHNLYNSLAAATAARLAGADDASIRRGLETFRGVEHRLEPVARVAEVEYINDSKATNIDSCRYALQSVETPIVLILGGTDKGNDYGEIEAMVRAKARGLVFLGVDNRKLHAAFDGKVPATCDARSMAEAIAAAARMARPGDTVLLSPCCASFDLFRNYEDRGEQFKQCVHALADGKEAGA